MVAVAVQEWHVFGIDHDRDLLDSFLALLPLQRCSSLPFRLSATVSASLTSAFVFFWGPTRVQIKNLHVCWPTSLHNSARIRSRDGFCDRGNMRLVVNVR